MYRAYVIAWMVSLGCAAPQGSASHGDVLHDRHDRRLSHDRHEIPQLTPAPGRRIARDERWILSHPDAIAKLAESAFGEREIEEFWTRKGWRLTK